MGTPPTSSTGAISEMSLSDWGTLPEDEPGELVDDRLVEEEVPTHIHEAIVAWLTTWLLTWISPLGGTVGGSSARFAVSRTRGRKPDVYLYFPRRLPPGRARIIDVPPDLMVEVVSDSPSDQRRDRVDKVREYAAFGVKFYWIVDPVLRTFEVLELGTDGRYVHALSATDGTLASIPGCAGLIIDLDKLWGEVDRLSQIPS